MYYYEFGYTLFSNPERIQSEVVASSIALSRNQEARAWAHLKSLLPQMGEGRWIKNLHITPRDKAVRWIDWP